MAARRFPEFGTASSRTSCSSGAQSVRRPAKARGKSINACTAVQQTCASFASRERSLFTAGDCSAERHGADLLKRYCVKGTSGRIRSEFPSMKSKPTISGTIREEGMRSEKLAGNRCAISGKPPAAMICFHLRSLKPVERVCITAGKGAHLQQEQCCLRREHL